ncbi:MAG: sulfurtransferase [Gemmobacter sp.]|uniref:sulfurtransferase n=1 Tax=Gemmobacter sp. TaxID=1898957 RepID=UPI003919FF26
MVKDLPDTPLVSAEWLAERLHRPGLVIVDTRKGDGHASAHIPGARKLALDPHLHHPGRVEDPQVFAAEMVRLGIGPDTDIIAYDDGNNLFAARLWWVLHYHGHTRARVLDGGWDGWVAAGLPVTDASAPEPDPGAFVPRLVAALLAETADMRAAMHNPHALILDVRGEAEWMRQEPKEISMAGHVPGARHLVWTDVIDPATHRFRPVDDLRTRFAAVGLRPTSEIITYCQGGIRATHSLLALTLAGFARVRNYEGSRAEWSRQAMPRVVEPVAPPQV